MFVSFVLAIGCPAPTLDHGYFLPDRQRYAENTVLSYGCDSEFKLDQEDWWGATTCTDGTWSTVPKCIGMAIFGSFQKFYFLSDVSGMDL